MEENKRESENVCEKKEDQVEKLEKDAEIDNSKIERKDSTDSNKPEEDSEEESEVEEATERSPVDAVPPEEELIDKGEDADTESDNTTSKPKREKKATKRKKKTKKSKMKTTDTLQSGDTLKRRSKSQPNKRKKIRKIISENKLQEETLQALRDEEERKKRLGLFIKDERREEEPFKFLEEENISTFPELSCDLNFDDYVPENSPNLELLQATTPNEIERILSPKDTNNTLPDNSSYNTDILNDASNISYQSPSVSLVPSSGENTLSISKPDITSFSTSSLVQTIPLSSGEALFSATTISSTSASIQSTSQVFQSTPSGQISYQQVASVLPTIPGKPWQDYKVSAFANQPTTDSKSSADVICISSESSGDEATKKPLITLSKPIATETINISSGTESSDDVIFAGTDDHEIVQEDPDVNNSGMHVNDTMNQPDHLGRVLVNKNRPPDEPEIYLSPRAAKAVKPHQIGGIRFMFDNIVESLEHYKKSSGFGCILAHSMGLGKTLQAISFIEVFLRYTEAKTALCVVPVNTLLNWESEFKMWLSPSNEETGGGGEEKKDQKFIEVRLLSDVHKTTEIRARVIAAWKKHGGVLVMGYEMFRLLTNQKQRKRRKRKSKKHSPPDGIETIDLEEEDRIAELTSEVYENLVKPGPDLIVCDEGHRIKNSHASISQALKQVATRRRIVLTGYPLQNNLLEYWCMVDFVRPNFLGTRQEFSNMFERPICNGQCADSNESDIRLMRFRSHVLHSLLKGFVQRRSHVVLHNSLPRKEEHVLMLRFSPWQKKLYNGFIKIQKENGSGSWCSALNPIKAFSICCKVWNHPDVLQRAIARKTLEEQQSNEGILDADLDLPDALLGVLAKNRKKKEGNVEKSENGKLIQSIGLNPFGGDERDKGINYEWAKELMCEYPVGSIELSGKMLILMQIIHHSVASGDKILVFSQSLTTLTLIEEFLSRMKVPNQPGGPQFDRNWAKNESYYRLDGNTTTSSREKMIQNFNSKANDTIHLFLLSTRAGCLGINLVGANRVVVFDISWNPCHDAQAVCRVYRYGQTKKCIIYRLICDQSMEKKIYDRQISKQGMADRVVDELNPIQSLERQDVAKLLIYDDEELPIPDLSNLETQDETLHSVCKIYGNWLTRKPFFHESLLMNCEGTRLTKAEKRAAEKGYEQEKLASSSCNYSRPSYASFYAAAGYPKKTTAGSRGSIFTKSSSTAPSARPVANVRPVQSTPYPMRVGASAPLGTLSGDMQIISHLQRAGIEVKKGIATQDIPLPQSSGPSSKPLVAAGEPYFMIRGKEGQYIGTTTGRIFALRTPKIEQRQTSSPLIKTPGGHMITARERESQIIKTAFNSMIQRNSMTRQPFRNPFFSQQQNRQQENYNMFQQQNNIDQKLTSLANIITGQNLMTQQNAGMTQQNAGMTQQSQEMSQWLAQNPSNTQNLNMMASTSNPTQQNQGMTQQIQGMTLQNQLLTQQNQGLPTTYQNQGLTPHNQVQQTEVMASQNQGLNIQNPSLVQSFLQNQQIWMNQQNQAMAQQSQMMNQQNQAMVQQSQMMNQQNQAHQLNQTLTHQNQEMTQQNQVITQPNLAVSPMNMQNPAMDQSNQSMTQQNHAITQLHQALSQPNLTMNMQNQMMSQQNLAKTRETQGLDLQSRVLSQQNQLTTQLSQAMSQQNQAMTLDSTLQNSTFMDTSETNHQSLPNPEPKQDIIQQNPVLPPLLENNRTPHHEMLNPLLTLEPEQERVSDPVTPQQLGNLSTHAMLQQLLKLPNISLDQQHMTNQTTQQTQNMLSQQGVTMATDTENAVLSLNNELSTISSQIQGVNAVSQPDLLAMSSFYGLGATLMTNPTTTNVHNQIAGQQITTQNPIVSQQILSMGTPNPIVSQQILSMGTPNPIVSQQPSAQNSVVSQQMLNMGMPNPIVSQQTMNPNQQLWNMNAQDSIVTQQNEMMTQQHSKAAFAFTDKN